MGIAEVARCMTKKLTSTRDLGILDAADVLNVAARWVDGNKDIVSDNTGASQEKINTLCTIWFKFYRIGHATGRLQSLWNTEKPRTSDDALKAIGNGAIIVTETGDLWINHLSGGLGIEYSEDTKTAWSVASAVTPIFIDKSGKVTLPAGINLLDF